LKTAKAGVEPDTASPKVRLKPGPMAPPIRLKSNTTLIFSIWLCVAAMTALAWAYLLYLTRNSSSNQEYARMMAEMGMAVYRPWTAVDAFFTFAMWTVMMIGMMTGSAAPILLLFAGVQRMRTGRRVPLTVLAFGTGYLAVWAGFSAVAAFAQWSLQRAALLSDTMAASKPALAAAIMIGAGAYQLTPFKGACLSHCRSPLGVLMTAWRDGVLGAFRMGSRHGVFCLGCWWALMAMLFAVGVMNLAWVAALTVLVLIEKVTPAGVLFSRAAGAAMIGGGVYLLALGG